MEEDESYETVTENRGESKCGPWIRSFFVGYPSFVNTQYIMEGNVFKLSGGDR